MARSALAAAIGSSPMAAASRQAGNLTDRAIAIQVFKPGIAVGVHPAGVTGQVILWVLAFAVG